MHSVKSLLLRVRCTHTKNLVRGEMQTPHQTVSVQALRNTRFVEEIARVDDRRPTFPLDKPGKPIGSDAAPDAENVQRKSSPVVYCGTDQQVNEGFAIALQIMALDTSFLPVGIVPATDAPNTEDM